MPLLIPWIFLAGILGFALGGSFVGASFVENFWHWALHVEDKVILWWTLIVTFPGVLAGLVVLILTWMAVKDTRKQAERNAESTQASFILQLRQGFDRHFDAHAKLRPGGAWHRSQTEPRVEDYAKIEVYMGLFEFCDELLERKFLNPDTFKRQYIYRIENLLTNRFVAHEKLTCRRDGWLGFINLCYRLEAKAIPHEVKSLSSDELKVLYPDRHRRRLALAT